MVCVCVISLDVKKGRIKLFLENEFTLHLQLFTTALCTWPHSQALVWSGPGNEATTYNATATMFCTCFAFINFAKAYSTD